MSSEPVIIKKRNRPAARIRDRSIEPELDTREGSVEAGSNNNNNDEEKNLPLDDLIELRRLRRMRGGIDVAKLNKGEPRKRKKGPGTAGAGDGEAAVTTPSGLLQGSKAGMDEIEDNREREENKARRAVRTSNFTQQTNALDVDKHMMAYIEENIKKRRGERGERTEEDEPSRPLDPQEELFRIADKYKTQNLKPQEEGNVTNSLSMLTAIPEVDLGMDARLKNIEDTEKAKRIVADARKERRKNDDEEHLASTRFFKPNLKHKSDADIIRDAKLEAMGLRPNDYETQRRAPHERNQTATDEMVMERFKKRMRK